MIDKYNREIDYVRLSITDKCNFRCNYCMDENAKFMKEEELLSLDEIRILVRTLKNLEFKNIRLTGGEPTLRKDIIDISKIIQETFGKFSITTNGSLMNILAKDLKKNGLENVNFSLDSLNRYTFKKITKRDDLNNVLLGLEKSLEIGLNVKINTVIQKTNLSEVFDLIAFAANHKIPIRFIELMPIGNNYNDDDFISEDILKAKIEEKYTLIPYNKNIGIGPSKYYIVKELNSYIGFISAITHNFCSLCNKIRISAKGDIYPCLAFDYHVSLKNYFYNEKSLEKRIQMAVLEKPQKHYLNEIKKITPMHKMGG
ncbi:GTP 3',8-cyclase MoaA [Marinitoga sp. 38H-ov]|uniref:GTP 3',8-cyclase MoaA n=1 Tax=Marinitoga sp. 38H-ov TaxID=1755814 RepID=UPI0013EC89A3|nr:GTP 3',8-cyclase MoaA [Marinitoga sp. 38H-ov]KAF2956934.1 hypothetical protein AS160_02810 [Marinitoga sp. 38H-ov]